MTDCEYIRPPQNLLPRFLAAYDTVAQKVGLTVSNAVNNFDFPKGTPGLMSVWHGTRKQMRATGFLTPEYRFPYGCCTFRNMTIRGRMYVERGGARAEVWWGELPQQVNEADGIEIITYTTSTAFNGTIEALATIGIPLSHLPRGRHAAKSGCHDGTRYWAKRIQSSEGPKWWAQRMPDGTFCYWCEDEAEWLRQKREFRAYVREAQGLPPESEDNQIVVELPPVLHDAAFQRFMQRVQGDPPAAPS